MKIDEAKKIADTQLEKLIEALKGGKSDTFKQYLLSMSKMYRYSFRNTLLIFSQKPDASYVTGFNAWKKMGRWVKSGEKGIAIMIPIQVKNEQKLSSDDTEEKITIFRAGYVFDVSQTEGAPFAEFAKVEGDPGKHLESLKNLISAKGINLSYAENLGGAQGYSSGGAIVLKNGLPPASEFSVLVHELAHELLHQGGKAPQSKTVCETEAEAVAFVISEAIGLENNSASSDYIQLYRGDSETLKNSLEAILKTSSVILSGLFAEE